MSDVRLEFLAYSERESSRPGHALTRLLTSRENTVIIPPRLDASQSFFIIDLSDRFMNKKNPVSLWLQRTFRNVNWRGSWLLSRGFYSASRLYWHREGEKKADYTTVQNLEGLN